MSTYGANFVTNSPVDQDGIIFASWTDQVEVLPTSKCEFIKTYIVFEGDQVCQYNFEKKNIIISNVFKGQSKGYSGVI